MQAFRSFAVLISKRSMLDNYWSVELIFISVIPQMKELDFTRTVFIFNTIHKKRQHWLKANIKMLMNTRLFAHSALRNISYVAIFVVTRIRLRGSIVDLFFSTSFSTTLPHLLFIQHCSASFLLSSQRFLLEIIISASKSSQTAAHTYTTETSLGPTQGTKKTVPIRSAALRFPENISLQLADSSYPKWPQFQEVY